MRILKSGVLAFWFIFVALGIVLLVSATVTQSAAPQARQTVKLSLQLADEIPALVASAASSPQEAEARARDIAEKAEARSRELAETDGTLSQGYNNVAMYARSITSDLSKEQIAWKVGVVARALVRLQNGDAVDLDYTDYGWQTQQPEPAAPASERVTQLAETLP